jgi:RNA polymerase sigma-70 factor (ECF subfamily)
MKDADHPSDREPDPQPEGSTSVSLIDRARGGEMDAWQQLDFVYRPLVQHWCCRRFGVTRPQDIGDVTQEVFCKVLDKLAGFTRRETGSFRKWLFTYTRLTVLEYNRRNRRQPQAEGGSDACARLHNLADPGDDSTADEKESDRTLLFERVWELIRPEFKPKTWDAVTRVLRQGQSPVDVAADLGLSVAAVYTAKSRVLKRLREKWQELNESDGDQASPPIPG